MEPGYPPSSEARQRSRSIARSVVLASFALSTLLAARLTLSDLDYLPAALALAAIGALALALTSRALVGPALSLSLVNALFAVPELGLRSAGFRHVSGIQFGYPAAREFAEFALDPELFWKLPPDGELVNSWGFFGPEPRIPKPAGELRIVYLGDSCSQQGYPRAWPELATAQLAERAPRPVGEVNLALSGYSSHQGRVLAERHAAELGADLVVVYFGWNDHWLARGAVDAEKRVEMRFERVYRAVRLVQLLRKLRGGADPPPLDVPRVPLDEYRANLRAIVAAFRSHGAQVVLLTAPTTHDIDVPDYLLELGFVKSKEDALALHRAYNDAVRELARELDAPLVDLEASVAANPRRMHWFLADGIHFNEEGRAAIAALFVQRARELALLR